MFDCNNDLLALLIVSEHSPETTTILIIMFAGISADKMTEATELHRSLAVDFGSVSTQWSSALRQLIIGKQLPVESLGPHQENTAVVVKKIGGGHTENVVDVVNMIDVTNQTDEDDDGRPPVKGRILHL